MSALPARFVFWQPMPSMHQVPFLEALATASGAEVIAVYAERLCKDRAALGWQPANSSVVREVFDGDPTRARLVADEAPTTLHVFSGFHSYAAVQSALSTVASGQGAFGVMSEAHDGQGLRGVARRARSAYDAVKYGRRVSFILAMGQLGVRWFRAAGFPANRVLPFAYVTPARAEPSSRVNTGIHVIYVGQLIHRKGVDLLLDGLARLPCPAASLTIVGTGGAEASLRARADRLGLSQTISWQGVVPNELIPGLMASHDLLVLPSRFDGWGAVVNEALSVGTPVLCSDTCGAADLLAAPEFGTTFRSGDASSLAAALRRVVADGPIGEDRRRHIMAHAQTFSADAVARYFLDVVASGIRPIVPPVPPWRADTVMAYA